MPQGILHSFRLALRRRQGDHTALLALATALRRPSATARLPEASLAAPVLEALLQGAGASQWRLSESRMHSAMHRRGHSGVLLGIEQRPFAQVETGEDLGARRARVQVACGLSA